MSIEKPEGNIQDAEAIIFGAELGSAPEIDLHAMDMNEAERSVDLFLNELFMSGERVAKIIHGRGSGLLREAVHRSLKRHPLVEYYRDAQAPHSMMGVTYAVLGSKQK